MTQTTKIWLNVVIGLILLIGIGLLVYYLPCPSSNQYIFVRVTLALSVACLSAILMGTIHIENNFVKASGAFAIFLIVLKFTPSLINTEGKCEHDSFTFEIYLRNRDRASIPDLKGNVSLLIQNKFYQESPIDNRGRVVFENIPINFSEHGGNQGQIELKSVPGFLFLQNNQLTLDTAISGQSMTIALTEDEKLCCLTGYIKDEKTNEGIDSVQILLTNNNQDTLSRKNGYYKFYVPKELRNTTLILEAKRKGYKTISFDANTALGPKTIFLNANN